MAGARWAHSWLLPELAHLYPKRGELVELLPSRPVLGERVLVVAVRRPGGTVIPCACREGYEDLEALKRLRCLQVSERDRLLGESVPVLLPVAVLRS